MIVSIVRATCPTPVEREFILHAYVTTVTFSRLSVIVDDFHQFLHYLYGAYAELSRWDYAFCMQNTINCEVNGRKFFVRVEKGGLRYGEL